MKVLPGQFAARQGAVRALLFLIALVIFAQVLANWVLSGQVSTLAYGWLVLAGVGIILATLGNWRTGLYLFVTWLLFEDFARKYLANDMVIYFGKDLLVGVCYISFLFALRRGEVKLLRTPVLVTILIFFWLGLIQVFNPNSPSLIYGLLGLKLYFYYIPLIFLGYALVNSPRELQKLLVVNLLLAGLIAGLGVAQSVIGLEFMNPKQLAPELQALGKLTRYSPITGLAVARPTSVFVSDGRFSSYLVLSWILGIGAAGYLVVTRDRRQRLVLLATAVVIVAILLSGSRGSFVHALMAAGAMAVAFVWGSPRQKRGGRKLVGAIQKGVLVAVVLLVAAVLAFPSAVAARWAFYTETLSLDSPSTELVWRGWGYPLRNLVGAFDAAEWVTGHGIGVSSLGVQYVSRLLRIPPLGIAVESGYGTLVIELGILGLVLWVVWTSQLITTGAAVVYRLRRQEVFPVGFAIWWFAFVLLFPMTFMGIVPYQNFVLNAYLWLLLGVLFRLPELETKVSAAPLPQRGMLSVR